MGGNIIITKGHHTCKTCVNDTVAKNQAPFKSVYNKRLGTEPFLGEGYYFWDDNIEAAQWWGSTHYKGNYTILEYDFTLSGDCFLDLVGSRQDIKLLLKLRQVLVEQGFREEDLSVSKCIGLLKEIEQKEPGVFPYTIIRAMDINCKQNRIKFVNDENRHGYMILDPRIIICFFDKNDIPLHNAKVVK